MGWKSDLEAIALEVTETRTEVARVKRLEASLHAKIDRLILTVGMLEKTYSRAADRMADRMIEMAMVRQGAPGMAATHRRTLQETPEEGADPWQDSPETQWPPSGCSVVNMP